MPELILVVIVIFLAVFTHTSTGFGIALVSMPMLTGVLGLAVAAPLVTIVAFTVRPLLLLRYRASFSFKEICPLLLAALLGIVAGSFILGRISNTQVVEMLLGVVVIVYGCYSLFNPRLPPVTWKPLIYGAGFVSGILARVYNVGGPPVIMYADTQGWQPATFKGNLQAYGVLTSAIVFGTRIVNGEYTAQVMQLYALALPVLCVGMVAGFYLERYIRAPLFRRMVLVLLVVVGVTLVF